MYEIIAQKMLVICLIMAVYYPATKQFLAKLG